MITDACLAKTIGEVFSIRETANNVRAYFVAGLIFNACFEKDILAINQIIYRLDGTVPDEGSRDNYANLIGDAIDDVMEYDKADQMTINPDDPTIIALAKTIIFIATSSPGTNYAMRKDKAMATEIVLTRTGGRKIQPTRHRIETKYKEPSWMKGLPEKEEDDEEVSEESSGN
jgi:hypothetical protein